MSWVSSCFIEIDNVSPKVHQDLEDIPSDSDDEMETIRVEATPTVIKEEKPSSSANPPLCKSFMPSSGKPKSFKCPLCEQICLRKQHLTRHMQRFHENHEERKLLQWLVSQQTE